MSAAQIEPRHGDEGRRGDAAPRGSEHGEAAFSWTSLLEQQDTGVMQEPQITLTDDWGPKKPEAPMTRDNVCAGQQGRGRKAFVAACLMNHPANEAAAEALEIGKTIQAL